jgi:hypothetical protein
MKEFDKMLVEFVSDTDIGVSFCSATRGGIRLSARRVP